VIVKADTEAQDLVIPLLPGGTLKVRYDGVKEWIAVKLTHRGVPVAWEQTVESGKALTMRGPAGALVLELRNTSEEKPRLRSIDLAIGESKEVILHDDD